MALHNLLHIQRCCSALAHTSVGTICRIDRRQSFKIPRGPGAALTHILSRIITAA